ncbi:hypothetical protein LSG31_00285 [Fodinisporobacter ferrooxydans]|uniref:GerMN domain-containing protein n=1 Tax=Fodinisporobacter ferrooxydans TaxID=2901836 RepID=A0ABY4CJX3_9BACL|nr:hypothetical protein LSG31_00285 [Alicyclobacillaceae bacterium MYW30-H2]
MLRQILNNLHPGINKDPQSVPAISISATNGQAIIQNNVLQLTGPSSAQYNLRSYTLGSLVQAINSQSGFSATLIQVSTLSAAVLIDGIYSLPMNIPMFTSFLWQLLKPVALAMVDAFGAENQALLEMILNTSDGSWLDSFGEFFDITRLDGEPDQLYAIRIFDLSLAPRVNNLAIEQVLLDLGYNATVSDDASLYTFDVNVTLPNSPPQGFVYSLSQLDNIVSLLQAAGTIANIILSGTLTDGISLSDTISVTLNTTPWTWGNFTWGEFTW